MSNDECWCGHRSEHDGGSSRHCLDSGSMHVRESVEMPREDVVMSWMSCIL